MLVLVAAGSAVSVPAGAQLFEDRSWFGRPRHQQDFPYFGDRGSPPPRLRPQQPVESFRAPPPRKVETPPTKSVLVIGDSLAEWLAFGCEEVFAPRENQRKTTLIDAFTDDNAPAELAPASLRPAAAPAELAPAPAEPREKAAPVPLND